MAIFFPKVAMTVLNILTIEKRGGHVGQLAFSSRGLTGVVPEMQVEKHDVGSKGMK